MGKFFNLTRFPRTVSVLSLCILMLTAILHPFTLTAMQNDERTVVGTVTSKDTGEPLVGVAVFIEGTTHNSFTDKDGKYVLEFNLKENDIISFQFLGMKDVRIPFSGQKVINVEMENTENLDEVVITGYSKIRKSAFTGNTIAVSKDDILKVTPSNMIQSLQVFDPSFQLMDNITAGSNPNVMPEFSMRGQTAINANISSADISRQNLECNNNLPIFILDGFEVSVEKIYDMDPSRISSLTLLKDAAATALYGSRAANGIIVIESRSPKIGRIGVTYNMTLSAEMPDLTAYNLMDAREKLEAEKATGHFEMSDDPADQNSQWVWDYYEYIKKYNNVARGVNSDWLALGVRNSFHQKHNIYIDGGASNVKWGAELKYSDKAGVMRGSNRETYGAGLTLDYRIGNFQIMDRVDFDVMNSNELPSQNFSNYSHLQPYDVIKDAETGEYLRNLPQWGAPKPVINPLYEEKNMNSFNKSLYNDFSNKLSVNWFIIPELTAKLQFSLDKKFTENNCFIDPASGLFSNISDPTKLGTLSTSKGEMFSYDLNFLLMFNKNIKNHFINVTGGGEMIETNMSDLSAFYTGFPSGSLHSVNNAMSIMNKPVRSSNKTRLASFLLMANYSYKDIYLMDASLRLDGSSEFGKDNKVAPFWSVGAGLNVHNYDFLKESEILSTLKLRATYGQVGRVNFPVYAAKSSYNSTSLSDWYLTGPGYTMNYLGNDALTWEKTNSVDAGIDLGFKDDAFLLRFTYYNKITRDMITSYTLPSSTGFTTYMANMGSVKNEGVEVDIRWHALKTKDWDFTLFGNLSHNKNRIMKISKALESYNKEVDKIFAGYQSNSTDRIYATPHTKFVENGSTTSIFGMKSLGINPENGREVFEKLNGSITYDWDAAEQRIIGNMEPIARGAFGFNLRWKEFSIYTSFLYRFGGDRYNQTLVDYVEDVNLFATNADKRVNIDRWKNRGDMVAFSDIDYDGRVTRPTSRFIQKDNTLQFNSLSLSYDFNPRWINRAKISMLRLTASMEDLGYWSTIKRERGLEYPFSRLFNFSLNVAF